MLPWFIALLALGLLSTAGSGIYVVLNGTPVQVAEVFCGMGLALVVAATIGAVLTR
jgi:hypothetical protein